MPEAHTSTTRYFVSHNGETKGPFDLDMIDAFILSGHYPKGVQVCAEGSDKWSPHTSRGEGLPAINHPFINVPKWMYIGGGILALVVFCKIVGTENSSKGDSSSTRYSSSASSSTYIPPTSRPSSANSVPATYSTPRAAATPADVMYKDSAGNTFRVSNSDYQRLSKVRLGISQEEAAISAIQTKIDAYGEDLDREKSYLDHTSQSAIDTYNAKVDKLNEANARLKIRLRTFNASVDDFNADLARVGTPIR